MSNRRKLLQGILVSIGAITITAVVLIIGFLQVFRGKETLSSTDIIRKQTVAILEAAKYSPISKATAVEEITKSVCGKLLTQALKRNNNVYSIIILGVWGDDASPIPGGTGNNSAVVQVLFPDKARIEMHYYAYTLNICRLVPNSTQEF
jgi:hypothetical protein